MTLFATLAITAYVLVANDAGDPLTYGPHGIGFRTSWRVDPSRVYRTTFDDGATYGAKKGPRPILVNEWYPIEPEPDATPMPYRGYFEIGSSDTAIDRLATALAEYARGIVVQEICATAEGDLDDESRAWLTSFLDSPTRSIRDATPAAGPFPLILYHSGAGSSYEDNASFCEYLASHGYVVIGSAFLREDGTQLGIDGRDGSARDIGFLASVAAERPYVDWTRIGLAGHSAGAQALLRYAIQPASVGDALVLLDTTIDYYGVEMPLHRDLVELVSNGRDQVTLPLLVAAGSNASFELVDRLNKSERTYLTLPHLDHNEYISQGIYALRRPSATSDDRTLLVPNEFASVCDVARAFFDAHLYANDGSFRDAATQLEGASLEREPRMVRVPAGVSQPPTYAIDSSEPPEPRQLPYVLAQQGAEATGRLLERFHASHPSAPIFESSMLLGSLLFRLIHDDNIDDAEQLYASVQKVQPKILSFFSFLADFAALVGREDRAAEVLNATLVLDPTNAKAAAKLKEIEEND